jgi:hypothetical protein
VAEAGRLDFIWSRSSQPSLRFIEKYPVTEVAEV